MKKIILLSFIILNGLHSSAQTQLWSMVSAGAANNAGAIIKMNLDGSGYTRPLDFNGVNGADPYGSLMQASNGKLYGMTNEGGNSGGYGVLFSFDPSANIYSKLLDFNDTNGANSWGSLMQASNGKLYGMTQEGGSNSDGVLFSFDPIANRDSVLVAFNGANGAYPDGSLIQATNGKLYGMTNGGGSNTYGVLFSFDPSANTYSKLLDFNGSVNGSAPYGSLMQATNGKLYGMTYQGGSNGDGVLFSFDPSANTYSDLLDFNGANGNGPEGSLIQATNGKLYGMTSHGGSNNNGVLFCFDPSANTYSDLLDFNDTANGGALTGSLMQASNGKLYGMTENGGSNGLGALFSFDPTNNTYAKLRDLNTPDGIFPWRSSFIEVANTSGINELSANETISVYPNPLTSSSTLQLNTQVTNAAVVIYDVLGKEMMRRTISGGSMVIEKGALASGVYFVKVRSEERQWVQKMIVQ